MSDKSKIEWTDATWNVTYGCTRVSAGCDNCYAVRQMRRLAGTLDEAKGLVGRGHFNGQVRLLEDRLDQPLRWKKPRRIFVNSLSDLFHPEVPFGFVDRVFAVIASADWHIFQILTKRPDRMAEYLRGNQMVRSFFAEWPPSWIWLGTSVENQEAADERIPHLLQTPAAVRFLSCEPLLGPVDLTKWPNGRTKFHMQADVEGMIRNRMFDGLQHDDGRPMSRREAEDALYALHAKGVKLIPVSEECEGFSDQTGCPGHRQPEIHQVIVGGESGPGARPCNVEWIRDLVRQCRKAGVAAFVKQLGADPICPCSPTRSTGQCRSTGPGTVWGRCLRNSSTPKGGDMSEWPKDLRVREEPDGD